MTPTIVVFATFFILMLLCAPRMKRWWGEYKEAGCTKEAMMRLAMRFLLVAVVVGVLTYFLPVLILQAMVQL